MRSTSLKRLACVCALAFFFAAPLNASNLAGQERAAFQAATLPDAQAESRTQLRAEVETPEVKTAEVGTAEVETVEIEAAEAAGATKRKRPNLFVRIVTAPFRGLAKLFGGGKSDSAARVKAKEEKQPTQAAAATVTASEQDSATRRNDAPPTAAAAAAATPVAPQPLASSATEEAFDYVPRPFTPYIEGVAGDPLSQGRALLENGYTNEAIAELSIAAVAGPDLVEANNLLGLAYDRRGQHKRAQEFYERARGVAPQNANVLNNLGHSLYLDDRYRDALARLKQAARLAPSDTRIRDNLGLVYGRLKKYDDALKQFRRAGGEFYARTKTANILVAAGRDRDAIKHYEAAHKLNPASADVLRQLITLYNRTGQREKAEAAQRALDKTPAKQAVSASS